VRFVPPAALDAPPATVDRWWGRCGVGRALDSVDFGKFTGDRNGGFDAATSCHGRGGFCRAAPGDTANQNVGRGKRAATARVPRRKLCATPRRPSGSRKRLDCAPETRRMSRRQ